MLPGPARPTQLAHAQGGHTVRRHGRRGRAREWGHRARHELPQAADEGPSRRACCSPGSSCWPALIGASRYWAWAQQASSMTAAAERSVNAVARLKADQIGNWLDERQRRRDVIGGDPWLAGEAVDVGSRAGRRPLGGLGRGQADAEPAGLRLLRRDAARRPTGARWLRRLPGDAFTAGRRALRSLRAEALRTEEVVWSDLYLGPRRAPADRDGDAAPVPRPAAERPAGRGGPARPTRRSSSTPSSRTGRCRARPARRSWWSAAATASSYLNELRLPQGHRPQLSLPLTRTELPAAMAVPGRRGIVEGTDYRGVPVFAAVAARPRDRLVRGRQGRQRARCSTPIRTRGWLTAGVHAALVVG